MRPCLLLAAFLTMSATRLFCQNTCQVKPGGHDINIPLRGGPNAYEPVCQPARIRVNDRNPVTIHVIGVSPTENCIITSSPPTVTAVSNPAEAVINSLTGLKFFDFESSRTNKLLNEIQTLNLFEEFQLTPETTKPKTKAEQEEAEKKRKAEREKKEQEANDKAAFDLYRSMAKDVKRLASAPFSKQKVWQANYKKDLDVLTSYLTKDFRGNSYVDFHPETDPDAKTAEAHASVPSSVSPDIASPPTEMDYEQLQSLYDQMKLLQPRVVTACTTAGKRCNAEALKDAGDLLDLVNAYLLVAQDNFKVLQTAQTAVGTAYAALHKVDVDYQNRRTMGVLVVTNNMLVQNISLGPDYGATDPRSVSCSTDNTPAVATTDGISVSVLYQNIPALTLSAGILTTFLEKQEIGTTTALNTDGTYSTYFALTDKARASVFPMVFVNYRIAPPVLKHWWGQPENELAITNSISAGVGVNPNTGTNQVEFFAGDAVGFSRVLIHIGVHLGRTEAIGGGFQLNTKVPTGYTGSPPIIWSYHPAFSIGFSVRAAPF